MTTPDEGDNSSSDTQFCCCQSSTAIVLPSLLSISIRWKVKLMSSSSGRF
jgi:hypothetical protein